MRSFSLTRSILGGDLNTTSSSKVSILSVALHRERVKRIKEEYMEKKRERKDAERLVREKRKQLICDTKAKLKVERAERIERNRILKKASKLPSN